MSGRAFGTITPTDDQKHTNFSQITEKSSELSKVWSARGGTPSRAASSTSDSEDDEPRMRDCDEGKHSPRGHLDGCAK